MASFGGPKKTTAPSHNSQIQNRLALMAYIEMIDERDAQGKLAELYERYGNPDGTVDSVMKIHSLNPESLEAHGALYVQSMHRPSPLSRAEREILGTVVSRLNGCDYCLKHHSTGLRRLLPDERKQVADEVAAGDHSNLNVRERAMVMYAQKLATTPADMCEGDVVAMRSAGLSDREILDAAQSISYFAYVNRMVVGLGAVLEEGDGIGHWPEESRVS